MTDSQRATSGFQHQYDAPAVCLTSCLTVALEAGGRAAARVAVEPLEHLALGELGPVGLDWGVEVELASLDLLERDGS